MIEFGNVKIFTDNVEELALKQIKTVAALPIFNNTLIRIMPDVHAGKGCTIGFVSQYEGYIIPNLIGVDIGCGVAWAKMEKIKNWTAFDEYIRNTIPCGTDVHGDIPNCIAGCYEENVELVNQLKCRLYLKDVERIHHQTGTLGGGNHFIEIGVDEGGSPLLAVHTGSRNLGKQVAEFYQRAAVGNLRGRDDLKLQEQLLIMQYRSMGRHHEIEKALQNLRASHRSQYQNIPDELAWLDGPKAEDYMHDMRIVQKWAKNNRSSIMRLIHFSGFSLGDVYHTVHNYIDERGIIRKGAVEATSRRRLIIPLNMKDGFVVCEGKGNPDWLYSAPHGAGRIMSRSVARKSLTLSDYKAVMKGVHSSCISEETIDESPMVYKPANDILKSISDTVRIMNRYTTVWNFKAPES